MRSRGTRWRATLVATCAAIVSGLACSNENVSTLPVSVADPLPAMPAPRLGSATLAGHVRDADGAPVAGATVQVTETDGRTTTDAAGAYRFDVPSDSTVTLAVRAPNMALTFTESMVLASGATVNGVDFALLAPDRVTATNALAAPGQEATRGLMAVRLHSLDPACSVAGAVVSVWPSRAATVVYAAAGATAAMPAPDPALTSVQDGADSHVAAWLAGTMPPGNDLKLEVEREGCRLAAASPSLDGLTYSGQRHVAAGAVTLADLFLEATP